MEQLKAFIDKAESDKELMDKLGALGEKGAGADDVVALAAEYGFTVTAEEIEDAKSLTKKNELGEEKLEAVAGGTGESIAGSENRYCPKWCKNLTVARWACYFPVVYCDHYRYSYRSSDNDYEYYNNACTMGAYPPYISKRRNWMES